MHCSPAAMGWACTVVVGTAAAATEHHVDVSAAELERLAPGASDPAKLVVESFWFLLEREPKETILRTFAIEVIERYFPEYPTEIRRRLGAG